MAQERPAPKPWWVLLLVAAAVAVLVYAAVPPAPPELSALHGVWVRQDGGYTLEIKNVSGDGRAEAVYRNPNPIRVERAGVTRDGAVLRLTVVLRDAGYPGSTYTLAYDPKTDALGGAYLQMTESGEERPFNVAFTRQK